MLLKIETQLNNHVSFKPMPNFSKFGGTNHKDGNTLSQSSFASSTFCFMCPCTCKRGLPIFTSPCFNHWTRNNNALLSLRAYVSPKTVCPKCVLTASVMPTCKAYCTCQVPSYDYIDGSKITHGNMVLNVLTCFDGVLSLLAETHILDA